MTKKLQLKTTSTALSAALQTSNWKLSIRELSKLSPAKIMDARELHQHTVEELERLRRSYRFFMDNEIEGRVALMASIKQVANTLTAQLQTIPAVPTLHEFAATDEEKLLDTLQLMIINLVEYYQTSEVMSTDMVDEIALRIRLTFAGLTLEDVALCFHQAKSAQLGKVYNRIDGAVIMEWLTAYQTNVQHIGMERNRRLHNQGKTGIWKDGHEYRIIQPKRLKELM